MSSYIFWPINRGKWILVEATWKVHINNSNFKVILKNHKAASAAKDMTNKSCYAMADILCISTEIKDVPFSYRSCSLCVTSHSFIVNASYCTQKRPKHTWLSFMSCHPLSRFLVEITNPLTVKSSSYVRNSSHSVERISDAPCEGNVPGHSKRARTCLACRRGYLLYKYIQIWHKA